MTDADRRTKAIEAINAHLASIETARTRVNKAKSELGTAEAELSKHEAAYRSACAHLVKLLPDVEHRTGQRAIAPGGDVTIERIDVVEIPDAEVAAS